MVQGIVGPFLVTLLLASSGQLAALGWQWPFALYALTFPILLFGFFCLWEPERRATEEAAATAVPFPVRIVALVCAVTLVASTIYFVQVIQFSLVLREIGVSDPALIGRISGIASIAVPVGALVFKRNAKRTINFQLAMVFLLMGIGLLGIGLSRDYRLSAVMALFQQTAAGLTIPCLVAWMLGSLPPEHRGRGMGIWAACFFVGQFVSPLVVSALRGLTGGLLPAVTTVGAICLVATVISLLSAKRQEGQ